MISNEPHFKVVFLPKMDKEVSFCIFIKLQKACDVDKNCYIAKLEHVKSEGDRTHIDSQKNWEQFSSLKTHSGLIFMDF